MVTKKEAVKIQNNASIAIDAAERLLIGVEIGDYVIKSVDTNKHGQVYVAVYKPTKVEDLELVELTKAKNINCQPKESA